MHRTRLALLGLLLVAFLAPSAALAGNSQVKLALLPVGQPGSYFDLIMLPGETRRLEVEIANDGGAALRPGPTHQMSTPSSTAASAHACAIRRRPA
jgi:hypothetical protein